MSVRRTRHKIRRAFTCLRSIAWCSNATTSSFSTPLQLNPLVHLTRRADDRLSWKHGNENVKPRVKCSCFRPTSSRNSAIQLAMWSNNYSINTANSTLNDFMIVFEPKEIPLKRERQKGVPLKSLFYNSDDLELQR